MSPADRINAYVHLIERIDEGDLFCMCPSLAMHIGVGFVLARDFPEIHAHAPEGSSPVSGPWFPVTAKGMQERKRILQSAIQALEPTTITLKSAT